MKYVYISLDAINAFASIRQYQSIDYELGENLYRVLVGNLSLFEDKTILFKRLESGIVFYTSQMDKNRGLLFDLATFDAFQKQDSKSVITIFQKILNHISCIKIIRPKLPNRNWSPTSNFSNELFNMLTFYKGTVTQ